MLVTLLAFAMPALGSNLLQSLSGSVTTLWVGRLLGPTALSATSNAHLVLAFTTSLLGGLSTAAGLLAGQALGASSPQRARAVVNSSVSLFLALSLPLALTGILLSSPIVASLAVPLSARPASVAYLQLLFVAMPISNLLGLLIAVLHGAGDARTPLFITLLLVVVDGAMAPLLIAGVGSWSGWGVSGAGLAYGLAQLAALVVLWTVLHRRRPDLAPSLRSSDLLRPDSSIVRWCLRAGSLVGLQFALISSASVALMGLVNRYGTDASAAYGVAVAIWSYVQLPSQAVSSAAAALSAHSVGAGAWPRVRAVTYAGSGVSLVVTGIAIVACYLLSSFLAGLFLPGEAVAAALVVEINRIVLWGFLMFAVTMVLFGVLRAVNDISVPFLVILLSHIGVRLPFAYGLAPAYGMAAIWWSYPAGLAAALVLTSLYLVKRPPWRPREPTDE